jgi:hypothetical protein
VHLAVPLCIIRHGETDWNVEGRLQGQKDISLNGRGRAQAEAVGRELARLHPEITTFDFVSSPLLRARETMCILRASLDLDPDLYRVDEDLRELTFGSWEGWTWSEVRDHDPVGAAGREADKWAFVPPGGENYAMLAERIAVDDFGTGASSLANLQAFPVDKIKIDRSFIAQLGTSHQADAIVKAVVGLGRGLDLLVAAEGVETESQLAMLIDESCIEMQGYLFSRARPIDAFGHITGKTESSGTDGTECASRSA